MNPAKKKKILFIGTPYMNLHLDIMKEMQIQGYEVDFIAEGAYLQDPNNIRCYKGIKHFLYVHPKKFERFLKSKWENLFAQEKYSGTYDILFVLDGQSIHPCVFEILKKRNPNLYAVNYLFDTTSGVYRFDLNFKYFDQVFSFDRTEVQKFGLNFLPIYWLASSEKIENKLDVFGLGRYSENRRSLFSTLKKFCDDNQLKYILKLGTDKKDFSIIARIKWMIFRLLGKARGRIHPSFKSSPLNTFENISTDAFRKLIAESKVVVDTSAPHQDGLTARFMWALGAGKKIITTNQSVETYDFYSPGQIFIVKDTESLLKDEKLAQFLLEPYEMPFEIRRIVKLYELPNWLKKVLNDNVA